MKPTDARPLLLAFVAFAVACSTTREIVATTTGPVGVASAQAEGTAPATRSSTSDAPLVLAPATTEAPSELAEVSDVSYYTDSIGGVHFVGLVNNIGRSDLMLVEVIVNLRDQGGTLVASSSGYAALQVVRSGETSPFEVLVFNAPKEWAKYEVAVQGLEAAFITPIRTFELISSKGTAGSFGMYTIVGEIKNTGEQPAAYVQVAALLYDASNKLIGVQTTFAQLDKIPPGGTSAFEILVGSTGGKIDHFTLLFEGQKSD